MANSIVRRSVAVAGVTLVLSGLLSGAASAAETVTGTAEALPRLQCELRADPPELEGIGAVESVRAEAEANCSGRADVMEVQMRLQKYYEDELTDEWREVARDSDRKEDVTEEEAEAEVQCVSGRYRTVAMYYARNGKDIYQDRVVSWPVSIRCR
jgi:hypothetical protein